MGNDKSLKSEALKKEIRKIAKQAIRDDKEPKYFCQNTAAVGVGTSGHLFQATVGLNEGTGADDRVGVEIRGQALELRGYMEAESADVTNSLRMMVVKARPGTDESLITLANFPSVYECIKPSMRDLYTVLHDRVYTLKCSWDGTNTVQERHPLNWRFNLRGGKIRYNDGATSTAGGGIFVYSVSDSAIVSHPDVEYQTQLEFMD